MSQLNRYEFVGSFLRPERLKEARKNYDVFFLDIDMRELDGFKLASFIESKLQEAVLIFVSAKEKYVFSSFRHHPLDVLLGI